MKHFRLSAILLVIICFFANNMVSLPLQNDDNKLLVKTATVNGKKELQISLSGKEAMMIGNLAIQNSSQEFVAVINEIDVKIAPEYYKLDISEFSPGTYTLSLNIDGKNYTSSFSIK